VAQADWSDLTGTALDSGAVARGVSAAFTPPRGGTAFVYGFNALGGGTGVAGKYLDLADFNPITGTRKGGSISAAIKRYSSGASYSPMIGFIKGTDPTAEGYLVGMSGATSAQIALKKGTPSSGLDPTGSDILRLSTAAWTDVGDDISYWHHIRMDVLVNPHGEVVVNVYSSPLTIANDVTNPSWTAVAGMAAYTDDSLGVLTGTVPHLEGFYPVICHYTAAAGTTSLIDHAVVERQTSP